MVAWRGERAAMGIIVEVDGTAEGSAMVWSCGIEGMAKEAMHGRGVAKGLG